VVVGGPPCQGFSTLNRSRSGDARNLLSLEMLRCADEVSARVVVVENVPQFLDAPEGESLVEGLRGRGFRVRSGVVNSADYGRRARMTIPAFPWERR
jgi:DNA (cytosine-5)-methyltransferase 1